MIQSPSTAQLARSLVAARPPSVVDPATLFAAAPFAVRLHVRVRWRLFPFPALLPFIPEQGLLADVGCGHGLWSLFVAASRPRLTVWGIDPDAERIWSAQQLIRNQGRSNLYFLLGRAEDCPLPDCDTITLLDVLYLLPHWGQEAVLRRCVERLRPGGTLLLKEMGERPRWKYAWNWVEEWLAVRALRLTWSGPANDLCFRSEAEWTDLLTGLGLRVLIHRLDRGYLHPHVLFLGQKR